MAGHPEVFTCPSDTAAPTRLTYEDTGTGGAFPACPPDDEAGMTAGLTTLKQHRCFGGIQGVYRHLSRETGTEMTFSVFVPPHQDGARLPVVSASRTPSAARSTVAATQVPLPDQPRSGIRWNCHHFPR